MIRTAVADDAGAMLAIYAPFIESSAVSFEVEVPTVEEFAHRMQAVLSTRPWLACEVDGTVAGYAYASEHRSRAAYQWCSEVSVYVHADYRGRKVGQTLYLALFDSLRRLGYLNAYAGITMPNQASIRLHESLGFTPVGVYKAAGYKFGMWHDVGWWQLALSPHPQNPAAPGVYA